MKLGVIGCVLFSVTLLLGTAQARTWLVNPGGTGDAPTIQAAMDSAHAGDAIILECGTYYEHDIQLKSDVLLTSLTGRPDCATVDANTGGGVMSGADLGPDTRIVGITLTRGVGPFRDDGSGDFRCYGGGLSLLRATLTIVNCVFADNITTIGPAQAMGEGGGIYCYQSHLTMTDCTFDRNLSQRGGGVFCEASTVFLTGCGLHDNAANPEVGGGLCSYGSSLTLTDCTFDGNLSSLYGGGVFCEASTVVLTGCRLFDNEAQLEGGGLCSHGSSFTLTGCVFARNSVAGGRGLGGGVSGRSWGIESLIDNCTFSANQGDGVCWQSSNAVLNVSRTIIAFSTGNALTRFFTVGAALECCDLYGNAGGDWVGGAEGQENVNGNFSLDPRFCAEESDNLALMQCSPCAPGNHPDGANCGQIGALPVACPGTAVQETTWGRIKATFR